VVAFALSQKEMGLTHIRYISIHREPHPHIYVRDESVRRIVQAIAFMGRSAHDGQCAYGTTRSAKHEPEPLETGGKLGKIIDIRPLVVALLADYLASRVHV
jgi:hypothetical protein